jgi:hypothetical protein
LKLQAFVGLSKVFNALLSDLPRYESKND